MKKIRLTRREFVRNTTLLTGGLMAAPLLGSQRFFPAGNDDIKIALIGCGGRGTGAITQALSVKENTRLVAVADAFRDQVDKCMKTITGKDSTVSSRVSVPESNKFVGFEGYKQAMALADVVILTTPPGFRPIHFEEAVKQGKQIFMEKTCCDRPCRYQTRA